MRDEFGIDDAGGVVGVVCVLMEENWVSHAGAEAGHVAANNFIRQAIDNLIPTLGISNREVTEAQIVALSAGAADAVSDAISGAQNFLVDILSFVNGDVLLGTKVFTISHDQLLADAFHDIPLFDDDGMLIAELRFRHFVPNITPFSPPILVADFEIFGEVQGIQTCPVTAAASLLKSQGFIIDENAREFTDTANQFRRRLFAGDRELGAWWVLAQRNTASMARVMRANPKVAERAAPAVFAELALALRGKGKVSEAFVTHATELLTLFTTHGSRQLRIDSKAALRILPSLAGKSLQEAIDILRTQQPVRIPFRRPAPSRPSYDQ